MQYLAIMQDYEDVEVWYVGNSHEDAIKACRFADYRVEIQSWKNGKWIMTEFGGADF